MGIGEGQDKWGANCTLCFNINRTPEWFKVFFSGIERGALWIPAYGMPPNGYYDIQNSHVGPCIWSHGAPPWPLIRYILQDGVSTLACKPDAFRTAFSGRIFENCKDYFTNLLQGAAGNAFYGGYAYIATSVGLAKAVKSLTPMIDPDPKMECFPVADEKIVIRYAGKRDATNISIKFDTNP